MIESSGIKKIDSRVKIPQELFEFIKHDTYSLLIKGDVGTGKTTLALTLLLALNVKKNCLYLSTRTSPEKMFEHYSWIENFFDSSKKLDLSDGSEVATDIATFVDARLDEPSSLYERITNELMDVKAPIIIIDSWDAISSFMDGDSLKNNARVLQTWRERAGAKIIFVSENPNDKTLDFLVDGIVELNQKHVDHRILREMTLTKLHGVQIRKPSYLFSLHNNLFHGYRPYKPSDFVFSFSEKMESNMKKHEVIIDNSHIKIGYELLDKELGRGFPNKGLVLLELDSHVNPKIMLSFLKKLIEKFCNSKELILFHSIEGINNDLIHQYIDYFKQQNNDGFLEIIEDYTQNQHDDISINMDKDLMSNFLKQLDMQKQNIAQKLILSVVGANLFQNKANATEDYVKKNIEKIKFQSNLTIIVTKSSNEKFNNILLEYADIHLKIIEISGNLLLLSKTPWTHFFAIVPNSTNGFSEIELESIV